jgi:hypothetical protein
MKTHRSLLPTLATLAMLVTAGAVSTAAEPDAACRAQPVGDAKIMKSHHSDLGACFETDRGNDPYRFGRTTYRKQTIGWRDRSFTLPDGGAGVEEYFCSLPIGILLQVYRCPCGIDARVQGRGVCRSAPAKPAKQH